MKNMNSAIFPFVLLLAQSDAEIRTSNFIFKYKGGGPLLDDEIISEHESKSQTECSIRCLRTQTCSGFNYKTTTHSAAVNCQLCNKTKQGRKIESGNGDEWTFYEEVATTLHRENENDSTGCKTVLKAFQIQTRASNKKCASVANGDVIATSCNHSDVSQWWSWLADGRLQHESTRKCLDVNGEEAPMSNLVVATCNSGSISQRWACDGYYLLRQSFMIDYGDNGSGLEIFLNFRSDDHVGWSILNSNDNICKCTVKP